MRLLPAAALLLLLAALPATAAAQADTTGRDPALPDIAPREVEIRGQLEISLPSLERQPLTGFDAGARVPPLPPNLEPAVATGPRPRYAATQELPGQTEPPRIAVPPPPITGAVEAGGGRYFSRFGRAHFSLPLTDRETVGIAFDYVGLDGHEPFDDADVQTPSDTFDGRLRFRTERDPLALAFTLDGFYDAYTLFGAERARSRFAAQPDRIGQHLSGGVELEAQRLPARLHARYGETRYETEAESNDPVGAFARTERRFDADGALDVPLGGTLYGLADAQTSIAGLDTAGGLDSDVVLVNAAGGLRANLLTSLDLSAAARVLHFTSTLGPLESATYVSPDVRLDAAFVGGVTGYVQNRPGADFNGLADLYEEDPYLVDEPAMQPTVRTVDAEGGLRVHRGPVEVGAHAGYVYAPSYRYFAAAETHAYAAGLTAPDYARARILQGGADVSLSSESGFSATLGVTVRNGRLTEDDTIIPYFAPVTGRALLSYAFAEERGLVQLTGSFESARYESTAEERQVGAFVDLDARAQYALTPALGLVLRVENVSFGELEQWRRYPLSPFIISTGLRVEL